MGSSWKDLVPFLSFECLLDASLAVVNSVHWSYNGNALVASRDSDSLIFAEKDAAVADNWIHRPGHVKRTGADLAAFLGRSSTDCIVGHRYRTTSDHVGTVRLWDMVKYRISNVFNTKGNILRGNGLSAHKVEGWFICSCIEDRNLYLYDRKTSNPVMSLSMAETPTSTWHPKFSPISAFENPLGLAGGIGRQSAVAAASSGDSPLMGSPSKGATGVGLSRQSSAAAAAAASDSRIIAVVSHPQLIRFLDIRCPSMGDFFAISLADKLKERDYVRSMEFTPKTNNLLISTGELRTFVLDVTTGEILREYDHPETAKPVLDDTSIDPSLLSSCPSIQASGPGSLINHSLNIGYPAISPDETVVAQGFWDSQHREGIVQIWNANQREPVETLRGFFGVPHFVAFHPNRAQLLIGDVLLSSWTAIPED